MKKKIISIAGNAGSGKSSTADRVAEALNYARYSSGDFMRQIAKERGLTFDELHTLAEKDESIDHEIDKRNKKIGEKTEIVIDSRLAFYFIPDSFKVFLELDPAIAAKRIFADMQKNPAREVEFEETVEQVEKSIAKRMQSNKKRYQELYNIDYLDPEQFDLVINTGKNDLETVSKMIVASYKEWIS